MKRPQCRYCNQRRPPGRTACEQCRKTLTWISEAFEGDTYPEPFPGFRAALIRHHRERVAAEMPRSQR